MNVMSNVKVCFYVHINRKQGVISPSSRVECLTLSGVPDVISQVGKTPNLICLECSIARKTQADYFDQSWI